MLQLLQEISLLKESIKERDAALLDLRMENADLQLKADQVPHGCVSLTDVNIEASIRTPSSGRACVKEYADVFHITLHSCFVLGSCATL